MIITILVFGGGQVNFDFTERVDDTLSVVTNCFVCERVEVPGHAGIADFDAKRNATAPVNNFHIGSDALDSDVRVD